MHRVSQLEASFRKRLEAFTREVEDIHAGNVEALHRTRVASRRLRELLPLLELDHSTTRKLRRRLRKVTRQLGAVRELDVLMIVLQALGQDRRYSSSAVTRISAVIADERAAAADRLAATLPLAKMKRLARRLEYAAEGGQPSESPDEPGRGRRPAGAWISALERRVARRAARVRSVVETAGTRYLPERLHDVRIALKKLRYSAELLAEAGHQRVTPDLAVLTSAQDLLGRLHDLEVLLDRVRRVQGSCPVDFPAGRPLASLVHTVEDDCRQLHARYLRDRARLAAIADRLEGAKRRVLPATRRAVG